MDVIGSIGMKIFNAGLGFSAVNQAINNVFETYSGVLTGAIILTLTIYFIRKILNGANKGKARLR